MFGLNDVGRHEKIKENVLPVTVLSSFVLASVALPMIPRWAGPLAVAQARKPQPITNVAATETTDDAKPGKSQTVATLNVKPKRNKDNRNVSGLSVNLTPPSRAAVAKAMNQTTTASPRSKLQKELKRPPALDIAQTEAMSSSASLPLPSPPQTTRPETPPLTAGLAPRNHSDSILRRHSHHTKNAKTIGDLSSIQKTRLLRQHYFRSQTQFLQALEDISNRLVIVPKQARMSALRAELALIARDLPAEIDVPVICPPTLLDGAPGKSRHHRIVRLNPTEATVLNSAEKVPYLLMVEVLREDFTFDPETPDNQRLLPELFGVRGNSKRLFDLSSELPKSAQATPPPEPAVDSVFEPTSGDLSSSNLIKSLDEQGQSPATPKLPPPYGVQRLSSGATTSTTTLDAATPRTSGASRSRSSSPGSRRKMTLQMTRNASSDQPDFSALATHMRTASQMLAQLDATSGKRPKHEVAAIRAKIIASMQSLEERSFDADQEGPTFDTIIAKASTAAASAAAAAASASNPDLDEDAPVDTNLNASAGRERMENDFKTGGVQRRGDRDDPSAAVFGEAWEAKKERIRKSSPYGWMKNWDLVSVIVKTGADLRQEAFACQLIDVCHKIWVDAGVDVWVKLMRILVTGESSGLIETITNGVSLHSLKRSLTMASIESGRNPRHRIATLKDHFLKAFGEPDSKPHRAGVDAFKRSLAAYSVISYILQLKDRHNGNVLIDSEGHIIHIDFGFMLSNSPGSVGFEAAPFKLTHEYVDVLGGLGSPDYEDYKKLCKQAFQGTQKKK